MWVTVWVKAGSRSDPRLVVDGADPSSFVAHVRERPIDGHANTAVEELIARHFGVSPRQVELRRGRTSRRKRIWVDME